MNLIDLLNLVLVHRISSPLDIHYYQPQTDLVDCRLMLKRARQECLVEDKPWTCPECGITRLVLHLTDKGQKALAAGTR